MTSEANVIRHEQWISNIKAGGHATAAYTCPAETCDYLIEAPAPEHEGETYDSTATCPACGYLHFKVVHFGGLATAQVMP